MIYRERATLNEPIAFRQSIKHTLSAACGRKNITTITEILHKSLNRACLVWRFVRIVRQQIFIKTLMYVLINFSVSS